MRRLKYTESNIPDGLKAQVVYLKGRQWVTSCHLVCADGSIVASGTAICSLKDQPVRKIGRAMAIGRALKKYIQLLADES